MDGIRAIADPVRREILELLRVSALPAGRIAEHFSISRPAISKHLRVLSECGVVAATESGRQRLYELRTAPLVEARDYLHRLTTPAMSHKLDALATEVARARSERRRATGENKTANGSSARRRESA